MAKEIIKEILLKFKGDTKGIERDLKNVEKAAGALQKTIAGGGAGGSSLGNMNKTIENFTKTSQKFGMSINKDMTKFQKTIQEVAQKDLRVLQQQTDQLFRKTEDRLKRLRSEEQRLQQMQQGGASPADVAAQQRRVRRSGQVYAGSESRFINSANEFETAGQGISNTSLKSRLDMGIKGVGGVASAVSTAMAFRAQLAEQESSTRALLAGTMQQRKISAYRGDITETLMEGRDRSMTKSQNFANSQVTRRNWGMGALAIAGIAGIAAPFTGGMSLAAGAAALGGVGALGASGMYFMGGGQENYRESTRQREFEREKQRNMTAYYANFLMGKAPGRYESQRLTGMGDADMLSYRAGGFQNMFSESQSTQTLMGMRGFGTGVGSGLASGAMSIARSQGMGLDTSASLMQTAALTGGQGKDAKKTLTDVYTDAFTKGITDSGLLEVFQKGLAEIVGRSPDVSDQAAMSARMTATLDSVTGGRGIGARDIMGAMTAANVLDTTSTSGGESGFSKMSKISDATGGNADAMMFLGGRTDREIHELASSQDPRLVSMLGVAGTKALADKFNPATTMSAKFQTTARGRSALAQAKKMLDDGASLTDVSEALGGYAETVGGTGPLSKEAAANVMSQVLQNTMPKESLASGGAFNEASDEAALEHLAGITNKTPAQQAAMRSLLDKRAGKDVVTGDVSYLKKFGAEGDQAIARQERAFFGMAPGAIDNTQAGALTGASMSGAAAEDAASGGVTVGSLKNAARATARATAPGAGISDSVDSLVSALKSFADAVKSESGSASSTASGSN